VTPGVRAWLPTLEQRQREERPSRPHASARPPTLPRAVEWRPTAEAEAEVSEDRTNRSEVPARGLHAERRTFRSLGADDARGPRRERAGRAARTRKGLFLTEPQLAVFLSEVQGRVSGKRSRGTSAWRSRPAERGAQDGLPGVTLARTSFVQRRTAARRPLVPAHIASTRADAISPITRRLLARIARCLEAATTTSTRSTLVAGSRQMFSWTRYALYRCLPVVLTPLTSSPCPAAAPLSCPHRMSLPLDSSLAHSSRQAPRSHTCDRPLSQTLDLPQDVCHAVCGAVESLPAAVASTTLRSLSLVSRTWSAAAQCSLYRDPWLSFDAPDRVPPRTFLRLEQLLRTLEERPDLARGVQALDAGTYTVRCQTEAKADRRLVSRLAIALVAACPSLRSLSLPFVVQADKAALLSALRQLSLLETFTFGSGAATADPWIINVDVAIKDAWGVAQWWRRDLRALAPHWPRLRCLVMQARVRGRDGDEGVPWALEAFELSLVRSARLSFPYLEALLAGCSAQGSLRCLKLCEHQLEPGALVELLEAVGANLEVLKTTTADKVTRNDALVVTISHTCPRLKLLALETPLGDVQGALDTLSSLPYLQSLALTSLVGSAVGVDPQALVARLEVFPALQRVDLATVAPTRREDELHERLQLNAVVRTVVNRWRMRDCVAESH